MHSRQSTQSLTGSSSGQTPSGPIRSLSDSSSGRSLQLKSVLSASSIDVSRLERLLQDSETSRDPEAIKIARTYSGALASSMNPSSRIASLLCSSFLADTDRDSLEGRGTTLSSLSHSALTAVVAFPNDANVSRTASGIIRHISQISSFSCLDDLTNAASLAVDWLSSPQLGTRCAGALISAAVAENCPSIFARPQILSVFQKSILLTLCDKSLYVRSCAAEALRAVVSLSSTRLATTKNTLKGIFASAFSVIGNAHSSMESLHGALVAVEIIFTCAPLFLVEEGVRIQDLCTKLSSTSVLKKAANKMSYTLTPLEANSSTAQSFIRGCGNYVRVSLFKVFILLAKTTPTDFVDSGAAVFIVNWLLSVAAKCAGNEREEVLSVITQLIKLVPEALEGISDQIARSLLKLINYDKPSTLSNKILQCILQLNKTYPNKSFKEQVRSLISKIFEMKMTSTLINYLIDMCHEFPEITKIVHSNLFSFISNVLSSSSSQDDDSMLVASLRSISLLNSESSSLIIFVKNNVLRYLDHPSCLVRQEAAASCLSVLTSTIVDKTVNLIPSSGSLSAPVRSVFSRIIDTVISSPDSSLRTRIMSGLGPEFDHYLCQSENLSILFSLLEDTSCFEVRIEALKILSRLTKISMASIAPVFRRVLFSLLTSLECLNKTFAALESPSMLLEPSPDMRAIELGEIELRTESTLLLTDLIRSAPSLVRLYGEKFFAVILPQILDDKNIPLSTMSIVAVGEFILSKPSGADSEVRNTVSSLINILTDTSPSPENVKRREATLDTLGKIFRTTGNVIDPLLEYPTFFETLLSALKIESSRSLRVKIIALIGVLGAVNPYVYDQMLLLNQRAKQDAEESQKEKHNYSEEEAFNTSNHTSLLSLLTIESGKPEYNEIMAIQHVAQILADPAQQQHHKLAIQTIGMVFTSLGTKCVPYLSTLLPSLFDITRKSEGSRTTCFAIIAAVTSIGGPHMIQFLPEIEELMVSYWDPKNLQSLLYLMECLSEAVSDDFVPTLAKLIPLFVYSFNATIRTSPLDVPLTERFLETFSIIGSKFSDFSHMIVPLIISLFANPQTPPRLAATAVSTLALVCSSIDLSLHLPSIIHSMLSVLEIRMRDLNQAIQPFLSNSSGSSTPAAMAELLQGMTPGASSSSSGSLPNPQSSSSSGSTSGVPEGDPSIIFQIRDLIETIKYGIVRFAVFMPRSFAPFIISVDRCFTGPLKALPFNEGYKHLTREISRLHEVGLCPSTPNFKLLSIVSKYELIDMNEKPELTVLTLGGFSFGSQPDGHRQYEGEEGAGETGRTRVITEQLPPICSNVNQPQTREDWVQWFWEFNLSLLQNSPSEALRLCYQLAQECQAVGTSLFPQAFLSLWNALDPSKIKQFRVVLSTVLNHPEAPQSVIQALLNLFEFMEQEEKPIVYEDIVTAAEQGDKQAIAILRNDSTPSRFHTRAIDTALSGRPLSVSSLGQSAGEQSYSFGAEPVLTFRELAAAAMRCNAYAKALRLKEKEYQQVLSAICQQESSAASDRSSLLQKQQRRRQGRFGAKGSSSVNYSSNPEDDSVIVATYKMPSSVSLSPPSSQGSGYFSSRTGGIIEDLITINNELQLPDAAGGILSQAQKIHTVLLRESWYEKLDRWRDALKAYSKKLDENPRNTDALLGKLRCLDSMGEHEEAATLVQRAWHGVYEETRREIAPMAASSSMCLCDWSKLERYTEELSDDDVAKSFYKAVLSLHGRDFTEANKYILRGRNILDRSLVALISESYDRAYPNFVRAEQFSELEEIMWFISSEDESEKEHIIRVFEKRLLGVKHSVRVWQKLMHIRELAINPCEHPKMWVEFLDLCFESNRLTLAKSTLERIFSAPISSPMEDILQTSVPSCVKFCYAKYIWLDSHGMDDYNKALEFLYGLVPKVDSTNGTLLADIYLCIGNWEMELNKKQGKKLTKEFCDEIMRSFNMAVKCNDKVYETWHRWAVVNADYVKEFPHQNTDSHVISALDALCHAINAGTHEPIQDVLLFLNLAFTFSDLSGVIEKVGSSVDKLDLSVLLGAIPQIIARIGTHNPRLSMMVKSLLIRIGMVHPQAIVYPLNVVARMPSRTTADVASEVFAAIRPVAGRLEDEISRFARELLKLGIFWHEMWTFGINEASRLCYDMADFDGMWNIFYAMYSTLAHGPKTPADEDFIKKFQSLLLVSLENVFKYRTTQDPTFLQTAWDNWFDVFKALETINSETTTLDLTVMMPSLMEMRNLDLCIPGTYKHDEPLVRIASVKRGVKIIKSKQRPRTVTFIGTNGTEYQFLLKGHEDLRQDERAMQFFGVVNRLLQQSSDCSSDHLKIVTYSVVPLSTNAGLIGWILHSDTFHQLVKEYRDWKGIPMNRETQIMKEVTSHFESLTLLQKVELFRIVLDCTDGMDMRNIIWRRSPNTEKWLLRRLEFTRTLAVMSMVGHILGIGDRHPSNLMMDRDTGAVAHIDFGDCFETAVFRSTYPEKIPFRLTRMLINVMEVSGIEGTFRKTCERVMTLLRNSKDMLLTVLETFIYDPLLTWKLLEEKAPTPGRQLPLKDHPFTSIMPEDSLRTLRQSIVTKDDFILHVGETPQSVMFRSSKAYSSQDNDSSSLAKLRGAADKGDPFARLLLQIGPVIEQHDSNSDSEKEGITPSRSDDRKSCSDQSSSSSSGHKGKATEISSDIDDEDVHNKRAVSVMKRVVKKLEGREFGKDVLDVQGQVDRLISQATSEENLSACYRGWCPFW